MLTNILSFFRKHIAENKEIKGKDIDIAKNFIEQTLTDHYKGIFPNIPKTGITEIDEEY